MISTDFVPNDNWDDVFVSLKTLFLPTKWKNGWAINEVKKKLLSIFPNAYPVLFLTARAAHYNCLKSLNLPEGTKVFVQGFTCSSVILPIIANKLEPIYIDIEERTFSMDLEKLQSKLKLKPRVLILQHSFGLIPFYREQILRLAKQSNIFVIEDLAHGFDEQFLKPISKIKRQNHAYLLSFGSSKSISSVCGGALITGSQQLFGRFEHLESQLNFPTNLFILKTLFYKPWALILKTTNNYYLDKIFRKIGSLLSLANFAFITKQEIAGQFDQIFNKKYPNALAIMLLNQLRKEKLITKQRRKVVNIYNKKIISAKRSFHSQNFSLSRYPLLIPRREVLIKLAEKENIFLGKWFDHVIMPKELDSNHLGYIKDSCPMAEKISKLIINLPTIINKKSAQQVVNLINSFPSKIKY